MDESLKQYLPKDYKRRAYYTPYDVSVHNTANDLWVSFFGKVWDLTQLVQENISSKLCEPLIKIAGSDISYWFDKQTGEPRKQVDINTGLITYYCPQGRYLHIPSSDPCGDDELGNHTKPWWSNEQQYCIGNLSHKTRKIKIINMLTDHEDIIEVPSEETINEILDRYKKINAHAASYTWKRLGKPLDMELTLSANGIPDETDEFEQLGVPESQWYIPAIHLYFNDDLTVA
ncbi:unnamed protein product [Paramecium primaurelia]|uniref:Cytochrome b5 heme-binding domain-containing protein n=1 Tax=Paramecium primaurelia TaxID=5886 RepID=A0A8S1KS62_PARPR|nr:unnamed protein product [Paramecium primaurelia]